MANFALGLKFGVDAGSRIVDNLYRAEEQDRKRQQWKREDDIRAAAGNTLGNAGTTREDGSVYDDEQALRDYAARISGLDPEKGRQATRDAEDYGLRRLQRKSVERQARYEDYAEDVLKARRAIAGGADPLEVFRGLATKFNSVTDGRYAGVTEDGQGLTLFDASTGTTKIVPFSPENVMKAIDGMHALASPKAMEDARKNAREDKKVGLAEQHYADQRAHWERTDATNDAYRRALTAAAQNRAGAATQRQPSQQEVQLLNDARDEYVAAVESGDRTAVNAARRKYDALLSQVSTRLGRVRPLGTAGDEKAPTEPTLKHLGGEVYGLGNRAFRLDERTNQLVEVSMPGGARDLRVPPDPRAGGLRSGPGAQPLEGPEPFRSSGQQTFGVLTPERTLQYEAAGGNPAAVEYLRRRDAARLEDELYRARGGLGQLGIAP